MAWLVDLINSPNAPLALCILLLVFFVGVTLSKRGLLGIHTKYVTLGAVSKEETIKEQQMDNAYLFIMALAQKIDTGMPDANGWKTRCILEMVYDEVVRWIVHNHIREEDVYVAAKQQILRNIVYNVPDIQDPFKTREFADRMDKWTAELISMLVRTRKVNSHD